MVLPFTVTEYAPMCCVMPPASPAVTLVETDLIQQGSLAVVDVAHDRNHGRTGDCALTARNFGVVDLVRASSAVFSGLYSSSMPRSLAMYAAVS